MTKYELWFEFKLNVFWFNVITITDAKPKKIPKGFINNFTGFCVNFIVKYINENRVMLMLIKLNFGIRNI